MGWQARLRLAYRRDGEATRAEHEHQGPLRVLKALYPEGPGICHHVLVHPPAGIVGGDELALEIELGADSHALLVTPGATRFYRSESEPGAQRVTARLASRARLEWLPGETIAYDGAWALNQLSFRLDEGAQMIGWDLVALGLPVAGAPFLRGSIEQRIEVHDAHARLWLDAGRVSAEDRRLLDSPLGLGGHPVLATMWWACGDAKGTGAEEVQAALDEARAVEHAGVRSGATLLHPQLIVWRGLADRVEPLQQALRALRGRWRQRLWGLERAEPRLWST